MAGDAKPSAPEPRLLRTVYAVVQLVFLGVFLVLCGVAASYQKIFDELGMTLLPPPTEAWLALTRAIRTPLGSILVASTAGVLVVMGFRGTFDRYLRKLIAGNVIGVAFLIAFSYLSIHLPLAKIEQTLKDR